MLSRQEGCYNEGGSMSLTHARPHSPERPGCSGVEKELVWEICKRASTKKINSKLQITNCNLDIGHQTANFSKFQVLKFQNLLDNHPFTELHSPPPPFTTTVSCSSNFKSSQSSAWEPANLVSRSMLPTKPPSASGLRYLQLGTV